MCDVLGRFLPFLPSHISRPSLDLFPSLALSPFLPPPPLSAHRQRVEKRPQCSQGKREEEGDEGTEDPDKDGREEEKEEETDLGGKEKEGGRSKEMISAGGKEEQATERKLPCVFPLFLVCPFFVLGGFGIKKGSPDTKKASKKSGGRLFLLVRRLWVRVAGER